MASVLLAASASAEEYVYTVTIKDHKFSPQELIVPVNQKIQLVVENQDATAEEFDSKDLDIEKTVEANKSATISIDPLKAGKYEYTGKQHEDTAKGVIIVAEEYEGTGE